MGTDDQRFLEGYLPYVLRKADQTLSAPFYGALVHHGVSRSEWRVLAVLAELGSASVVHLADAALSPQPTVTHAVARLEKRGLVTRSVGESDRRQRFVAITESGAELTAVLIADARRLSDNALDGVGDLEDLVGHLERLIGLVEANLA